MTKILITGGAGFIGTNSACHFLEKGWEVTILDNFSRAGSKTNIKFLQSKFKKHLKVVAGDIRYAKNELASLTRDANVVIHLAAQVAVTTSVINPHEDFEINALGTLNVLEAVRKSKTNPVLLYSSTNKVYGNLSGHEIVEKKTRYEFKKMPFGVPEDIGLDFYSPYGCSKGTADQYVHDYARIYGLRTIVFRQSCIYGPHQFGIEDQGWLAWFTIASLENRPITIYGTGKQVRDALYIDDLVNAYDMAIANIQTTKGRVYNIGGGPKNTISIWYDFFPLLEKFTGEKIKVYFKPQRPGDQLIYVSDIRKSKKDFSWQPQVSLALGLNKLFEWIAKNKS